MHDDDAFDPTAQLEYEEISHGLWQLVDGNGTPHAIVRFSMYPGDKTAARAMHALAGVLIDADDCIDDQPDVPLLNCTRKQVFEQAVRGTWVEIGVDTGAFARYLHTLEPKWLHLVDPWTSWNPGWPVPDDAEMERRYQAVRTEFKGVPRVCIHRMTSAAVAQRLHIRFDAINLDASHDYRSALNDLRIWSPKVVVNGLIVVHDYIHKHPTYNTPFGVIDAVTKFVSESNNWELLGITNKDPYPSAVLRRIL